jgi:hypothetical protein
MNVAVPSGSQKLKKNRNDMMTKVKIVAAVRAGVAFFGRLVLVLAGAVLTVYSIARAAHLPWEEMKIASLVLVPILVAVFLRRIKIRTRDLGQAFISPSISSFKDTHWRKIDPSKKKMIGGLLVTACFACIPPYTQIRMAVYSHTEQSWSSTKGQIQTIRVDSTTWRGHTRWYPVWSYSYAVNGTQYSAGSTDLTAHYQVSVFNSANNAARLRPLGTEATVFYDPNAPQHSVLDPLEISDLDWEVTLLTLLFPLIPFGTAAALYSARSHN